MPDKKNDSKNFLSKFQYGHVKRADLISHGLDKLWSVIWLTNSMSLLGQVQTICVRIHYIM